MSTQPKPIITIWRNMSGTINDYYYTTSMSYYEIIWAVAVIIGIVSYIPYLRDMFHWTTKPHAFTWFIRALMTWIAFAAQLVDGGGAWTRAMWITMLASTIIFIYALVIGDRRFDKLDYIFLATSLVSLLVWYLTDTPLWSVIIITIADVFAFIPTFRKSRDHPYEETLITYTLSLIKMWLSVIALENFTTITALYPLSLVVMNGLFVLMSKWRRQRIQKV